MKEFRLAVGFVAVVGLWYAVGYIQGYAVGYDYGLSDGKEVARKAATSDEE